MFAEALNLMHNIKEKNIEFKLLKEYLNLC